eukprot:TRINITY_DN10452_c2_g1_i1.p1 TRINITY_DN10452_c2_g1~~TRINITY_DN10452_c2_g1_i1.p1  ORF type:complete len:1145 (+),score=355.65 TRINITY_DN10452_c2_g1_i1:10-3444(+)
MQSLGPNFREMLPPQMMRPQENKVIGVGTALRGAGLTPQQRVAIATEAAVSLSALHSAGQVHLALKCDSLVMDSFGNTKILRSKFGRQLRIGESETLPHVIGTPGYLSPEALNGVISSASDVFALGIIFFEILTKMKPNQMENMGFFNNWEVCYSNLDDSSGKWKRGNAAAIFEQAKRCVNQEMSMRPQSKEVAQLLSFPQLPMETFISRSRLPESGKHVVAQYDHDTIVLYLSLSQSVCTNFLQTGKFDGSHSINWFQTSFYGIVKQSKWGTKKDHERILAFRIPLSVFVQSLSIAVPSTFQKSESYPSESQWKEAYERSETFFEWYGEIEIHGQAVKRKSIRLGLKAKSLTQMIHEKSLEMEDMTDFMRTQKQFSEMNSELFSPLENVLILDAEISSHIVQESRVKQMEKPKQEKEKEKEKEEKKEEEREEMEEMEEMEGDMEEQKKKADEVILPEVEEPKSRDRLVMRGMGGARRMKASEDALGKVRSEDEKIKREKRELVQEKDKIETQKQKVEDLDLKSEKLEDSKDFKYKAKASPISSIVTGLKGLFTHTRAAPKSSVSAPQPTLGAAASGEQMKAPAKPKPMGSAGAAPMKVVAPMKKASMLKKKEKPPAAPTSAAMMPPPPPAGFAAPSMSPPPAPGFAFGAPIGGFGAPTGGFGAPTGGFGAPTGGFGAPTLGFGGVPAIAPQAPSFKTLKKEAPPPPLPLSAPPVSFFSMESESRQSSLFAGIKLNAQHEKTESKPQSLFPSSGTAPLLSISSSSSSSSSASISSQGPFESMPSISFPKSGLYGSSGQAMFVQSHGMMPSITCPRPMNSASSISSTADISSRDFYIDSEQFEVRENLVQDEEIEGLGVTLISAELISQMMSSGKVIASGGFGEIFCCKNLLGNDEENVAIKIFRPTDLSTGEEIDVNKQIKAESEGLLNPHPNIIKLFGVCIPKKAIVMEFAIDGDLSRKLKRIPDTLSPKQRLSVAVNIVMALEYLHTIANFVHFDVKPQNVLLFQESGVTNAKLADFGLCRHFVPGMPFDLAEGMLGSPCYIAAEIIKGDSVSEAADVFSFGVTLIDIVTCTTPLQRKAELVPWPQPSKQSESAGFDHWGEVYHEVLHLALSCASKNPSERPITPNIKKELAHFVEELVHEK